METQTRVARKKNKKIGKPESFPKIKIFKH